MINATLRGKPDAGNPHVRFDEGEVAPAEPRRGSLLYKIGCVGSFVLALAGSVCCHADVAETKAYVEGSTLKLDVKSGETLNYNTSLSTLGVTAVEKDGLGRAKFNYGIAFTNSFTGTILIKAGTLGASSLDNYGTPSAITVEDGGALDLSQDSGALSDPRKMYNGGTKLIFSGSGPDGWAVYRKTGGGGANHVCKNAEMKGDATIGGAMRWVLGGDTSNGMLNMNSHTLTIDSSSADFILDGLKTVNPGKIIKTNSGSVVFQSASINMGGGAENELLLKQGTVAFWVNKDGSIPWRLAVAGTSSMVVNQEGGTAYNYWNGDVLHTNGTFDVKASKVKSVLTLKGNWTTMDCDAMAGGKAGPYLRINKGGDGLVRFLGGAWTNAMLHGAKSECLDIEGGRFEFAGTGPHLMGRVGVHSTNVWLRNCGHITKCATWYVENARNSAGSNLARLYLDHLSLDETGGNIALSNSAVDNWSLMRIGEEAFVTSRVELSYNGLAALHIADGGRLTWRDGHVSNNSKYSAENRMAQGYVLLDDGEIERQSNLCFGYYGRAVYLQRSGKYTQTSGSFLPGTRGDTEIIISGGTFRPISGAKDTWKGQYENSTQATPGANRQNVTVRGTGVLVNHEYCFAATNACQCSMMLADGGTWKAARMYLNNRDKKPGVRWDLGFDGGVLKPMLGWVFFTIADNSRSPHAITVYDGGAIFDTDESEHERDYKTGYDYGADCQFSAPLLAPTGKSILSISLPTDSAFTAANRYNVPPKVYITGTGHAATAIADLDDETGVVKGITVTCPGYGYDDSTTVTLDSWNSATTYPCAVTLGEIKGGGLIKRGKNGLVLRSSASTFAGDITVEGGFLRQEVLNAIPSGRSLNLASGTFDMNCNPLVVNRLTGYGCITGCVNTSTHVAATLTVTGGVDLAGADILAGKQIAIYGDTQIVFGEGAKINITGFAEALAALTPAEREVAENTRFKPLVWPTALADDAAVPEIVGLPEQWRGSLSADRRSIRVSFSHGTVLVVR